jgi:hypothetical protein
MYFTQPDKVGIGRTNGDTSVAASKERGEQEWNGGPTCGDTIVAPSNAASPTGTDAPSSPQ